MLAKVFDINKLNASESGVFDWSRAYCNRSSGSLVWKGRRAVIKELSY